MTQPQAAVAEPETPSIEAPGPIRHKFAYLEMLISSALGLIASLVLSIEAVHLAADPNADLSCNINANISCGAVGLSWQNHLLGFPNPFIGLICEPVVITLAVAALGRVRFPRWFMLTAQVVYGIGFVFAIWLFFQAYFVIGALCPWCLLVTVTTTLVFASMTRVNILDGNFGEGIRERLAYPLRVGADGALCVLLIAAMAGMVIIRYL